MITVHLTDSELNALHPEQIVVVKSVEASKVGEIQTRTASQVIRDYQEVFVNGSISDALDWYLFSRGSDSFSIIIVLDNLPYLLVRR